MARIEGFRNVPALAGLSAGPADCGQAFAAAGDSGDFPSSQACHKDRLAQDRIGTRRSKQSSQKWPSRFCEKLSENKGL